MTLWEAVTGNSTLPLSVTNTFWDHLHNPQAGGGGIIHVQPINEFFDDTEEVQVDFEGGVYEVFHFEVEASVEILSDEDAVQFFTDEVIVYVDS
jgi:hypothetical protein